MHIIKYMETTTRIFFALSIQQILQEVRRQRKEPHRRKSTFRNEPDLIQRHDNQRSGKNESERHEKNSRDIFQLMGSGFLMKLWSDDKDVTGAFRSHRSTFYDVCSVLLKQQDIKSSCLTFGFKLKHSILNNNDTHTHQVKAQLSTQGPFSADCVMG